SPEKQGHRYFAPSNPGSPQVPAGSPQNISSRPPTDNLCVDKREDSPGGHADTGSQLGRHVAEPSSWGAAFVHGSGHRLVHQCEPGARQCRVQRASEVQVPVTRRHSPRSGQKLKLKTPCHRLPFPSRPFLDRSYLPGPKFSKVLTQSACLFFTSS